MKSSLLTPKCTLVPSNFFNPATAREYLAEVVELGENDEVKYISVPQYDAVLVYSNISGEDAEALPEMFHILEALPKCEEYNKIVCSHINGYLYIAVAQGNSLLLANVFQAPDFVTAEYYIFLAVKSHQINPEVSKIHFRSNLRQEDEFSLYQYFKSVDSI